MKWTTMVVVISAMALVYGIAFINIMAAVIIAFLCGIGLLLYGAHNSKI